MNAWLNVLDKLGSGTFMLRGYVSTTRGLRLLGAGTSRGHASARSASRGAAAAAGECGGACASQGCS